MSATVTRTEVKVALPNPNTSVQPTPGASLDPAADRIAGLQVEQRHGYATLSREIILLGPTLAPEDLVTLEAAQQLLMEGGAQSVVEAGADAYEAGLARITPTLGADDLSALNSVLLDLRFLDSRLRANESLAPLVTEPDPGAALEPSNQDRLSATGTVGSADPTA